MITLLAVNSHTYKIAKHLVNECCYQQVTVPQTVELLQVCPRKKPPPEAVVGPVGWAHGTRFWRITPWTRGWTIHSTLAQWPSLGKQSVGLKERYQGTREAAMLLKNTCSQVSSPLGCDMQVSKVHVINHLFHKSCYYLSRNGIYLRVYKHRRCHPTCCPCMVTWPTLSTKGWSMKSGPPMLRFRTSIFFRMA